MRFQHSWNENDTPTEAGQENLEATVARALELGIFHVETARGYGTSEVQLGRALARLPRERIILQSKVAPDADPKTFLKNFERSMAALKVEYLDLFALHGINTPQFLEWSTAKGGCLEAALQLKKEGRVRHVGFSTHGPTSVIVAAINDGRFDFVNLHWYYFFQNNWPAIEAAQRQDMGVLIISPNDKGGKLYQPSSNLAELTAPLSPMAFNALWCLAHTEVHTLSLGTARPSDFDEHLKALPSLEAGQARALFAPIEERLTKQLIQTLGREWVETWQVGLPDWQDVPGQVNIKEILRLRNLAKAFDMIEYGKMRYNLLGNGDHWFPGYRADKAQGLDLSACLKNSPHAKEIPAALAEAHALLSGQEVKRLGKH
jgi:predicted aldo/keto reductase-like oxidoreductase